MPDGRDRGGVDFLATLPELSLDPRCGVRDLAAGAAATDGVAAGVAAAVGAPADAAATDGAVAELSSGSATVDAFSAASIA